MQMHRRGDKRSALLVRMIFDALVKGKDAKEGVYVGHVASVES